MPQEKISSHRPRVGLVLGAGSARGLAHIGVLQVLTENRIPFDFIVGSSIGAVIGAVYGAGADLYMLEKMAGCININGLLDVKVPRMGFVGGEKVQELIHLLTKGRQFEELSLRRVATDSVIRGGANTGTVSEAVRASISIPGALPS